MKKGLISYILSLISVLSLLTPNLSSALTFQEILQEQAPPMAGQVLAATTNGLVAHYKFDETSGTTAGDSVGSNPGTLQGGPSWTTGKIGGGVSLDGVDDYISLASPNPVNFANNFTVTFWAYPTVLNASGGSGVWRVANSLATNSANRSKYDIRLYSGRVSFITGDGTLGDTDNFNTTVSNNSWAFFACSLDGSNVKACYKDGVLISTATNDVNNSAFVPTVAAIGTLKTDNNFFGGILDDLRVYNRALSVQEITDIYNDTGGAGSPPTSVNGLCGTAVNSCTLGTFSDITDNSTNYLWSCQGLNGGTNASCSLPITSSDTTPPSTPQNLSASTVSSSQINLSWSASTDNVAVTGYRIYRNGSLLVSNPSTLTTYSDSSLSPNTLYSYTVSAYDAAGNNSSQSTSASATTQASTPPPPAGGSTFYIRDGGTGNCADWTNACDTLPATLQRGATYYIADGSYGSYTFDDPASGTTLITIKKATQSDHGTNTGWSSAYGDGQASFGPLSFTTQYWRLDGTSRTTLKSGYGIFIDTGPQVSPSNKGIRLNGSGNVTIRYVEVAGHGPDGDGGGNDLIYASQAVSNVTIQYSLLRDAGRTHLLTRAGNNWVLEHSVLLRCESTSTEHSESWSPGRLSDVTVRHNLYEEIQGTGILATLDNLDGPNNWQIYGNVFYNSTPSGGVVTTDAESGWTNVKFYNNTIHNVTNAGIHVDNGDTTGWEIYNNLWHNSTGVVFASDQSTFNHNYNWFYPAIGTGGDAGEINGQVGTANPFVNPSAGDFHLSSATNPGTPLSSPYNIDMNGTTRGSDGVWDRGAYEYTGSTGSPPPATPTAGDLNLDHIVNTLDFSLLNSRWNTNYPAYDLVPDGIINTLDFAIMSSNWGKVW